MLVLSRRINESIRLPGLNLEIAVLGVKSNQVRLGVNAPREVPVVRDELMNPQTCPEQPLPHSP